MSAPSQSSASHNAHVEDSEDEIEVLVFKNTGSANDTISTTPVVTNNTQNNEPSVRTLLKRLTPKPPQRPLGPENRMARAGSREKTSGQHDLRIHESSDCPTGRQSLLGGPFAGDPNIVDMDQVVKDLLEEEPTSATPDSLSTHTFRSTTTTNTTTTSKVSKSNSTHIALFNTLSPIQRLGRRNKMNSIRNKLKDKTCEEFTQLYNSTGDPDFRKLMSEVYYENCMQRLDDWERKL